MTPTSIISTNVFNRLLPMLFFADTLTAVQMTVASSPIDLVRIPHGPKDLSMEVGRLNFKYSKANDYAEFKKLSAN